MTTYIRLRLDDEEAALQQLDEAVEGFGTEESWPPRLLFQLRLVLEELAANIINYGYESGGTILEVEINSASDRVTITCTDDSYPFNPLTDAVEPDIDADLGDRPVGGLGIHIVKSMMDEIEYLRHGEKNHLTMVKLRAQ